jgi:hypothetical protein
LPEVTLELANNFFTQNKFTALRQTDIFFLLSINFADRLHVGEVVQTIPSMLNQHPIDFPFTLKSEVTMLLFSIESRKFSTTYRCSHILLY